jgi:transcriptional regulator with XRE-family HTH domain
MTALHVVGSPARTSVSDRAVAGSERRRTELADFLRARRARLTPQDLGLLPGLRRRTPGLRREEVAQLAGVGVTWYTWLEQGRPIHASPQVLDAVARTLRLDAAEREHLFLLAEAPVPAATAGPAGVSDALREIVASLEPTPAYVLNSRYDVLVSNEAHRRLVWHWDAESTCSRRNVLWCLFTEPDARARFVNFDDEVPKTVAMLRASFGRHVGEPAWTQFIDELSAASPEFAQMWARHDVAGSSTRTKHFLHPAVGVIRFTTTSLAVADMPECRLVVFTPADDESRARIAKVPPG